MSVKSQIFRFGSVTFAVYFVTALLENAVLDVIAPVVVVKLVTEESWALSLVGAEPIPRRLVACSLTDMFWLEITE
jgi:hypothetical protein